jgi:hypothetical protein
MAVLKGSGVTHLVTGTKNLSDFFGGSSRDVFPGVLPLAMLSMAVGHLDCSLRLLDYGFTCFFAKSDFQRSLGQRPWTLFMRDVFPGVLPLAMLSMAVGQSDCSSRLLAYGLTCFVRQRRSST